MQRNTMRKKLLLGTVALVAGVGLASAQGMREGVGGTGGAAEHGMSSGSSGAKQGGAEVQSKGKAETRGAGAAEHSRGQAQSAQPGKDRMSGQAKPERSTTGRGSSEKDELKAKSSQKDELKAKSQGSPKTGEKSTTGQGAGEKSGMTQKDHGPAKKRETTGQGSPDSKSQQSQSPQMNQPAQKQDQNAGKQNQSTGAPQNQNAAQKQNLGSTQQSSATIQSQAGTQITAQQQTTIRQNVLSARNVPRVDRVHFAVHTGAVVPRSVHVVSVSTFPVLVEVFPRYRDYSFFVVEDEIVIVDRGQRIVDVVPTGPRARFSRSGKASSVAVVNLSEPEIRILQETLIERRFLHGRVTGVFDARTRMALIAFQRKEGFEATGRIDTQTVTALGLSGRIKAQEQSSSSTQGQSSSSTQGQGGMQQQSGSGGQNTTGQANPPAQNPSATGKGQSGSEKPTAQQNTGGQPPAQGKSTTGQGTGQQSGGSTQPGMSDQSSGSAPSTSGQGNEPPVQKKQ